MCGIAGVLAPKGRLDARAIEAMVEAIHHRGPDDHGVAHAGAGAADLWLGNTRLAIIDLSSAGHMPMAEPESGNLITYNGEIYNHREIRRDLEGRGESFRSRTDTEVILRLYRREGVRCLEKLRGMFAFAIWDPAKSELFLARDRAGKKPLYWCEPAPGVYAFASEVRALLAGGLAERRLDREGLEVYLANGFAVSPRTLIQGIHSLLPGRYMRVAEDGRILDTGVYWRPPRPQPVSSSGRERLEEDRRVFQESVALRLISDVRLGVFLSGGMDSSAVVGSVARSGVDLETFSIGFPQKGYDESPHSRRVASYWKTRHTEVTVGEKEFFSWLPDALAAMDQPTFDGVNVYLVSRAARSAGLKVALSGLGADELFGGYPFFKAAPQLSVGARYLRHAPRGLATALRRAASGPSAVSRVSYAWKTLELLGGDGDASLEGADVLGAYLVAETLFPSWARRELMQPAAGEGSEPQADLGLPAEFVQFLLEDLEGLDRHSALSLVTWRLFLGERCLRDADSMSMGVSLEVRAPFTDHLFVERMLSLPGRTRCAVPPDKPFEQNLLKPWLEDAWEPRGKQGFVMPFREWLRSREGKERIESTLRDSAALKGIGLRPEAVARLWEGHQKDPATVPWSRVWSVFALSEWCRRWRISL